MKEFRIRRIFGLSLGIGLLLTIAAEFVAGGRHLGGTAAGAMLKVDATTVGRRSPNPRNPNSISAWSPPRRLPLETYCHSLLDQQDRDRARLGHQPRTGLPLTAPRRQGRNPPKPSMNGSSLAEGTTAGVLIARATVAPPVIQPENPNSPVRHR